MCHQICEKVDKKQQRNETTKLFWFAAIAAISAVLLLLSGCSLVSRNTSYSDAASSSNNETKGNLNLDSLAGVTVDRGKPEDPFWMLLVGTDFDEGGVACSDAIIMANINPGSKTAALISIPRDTRIQLQGYGYQKINAAYAYGEVERIEGKNHSGAEFVIQAITDLTGVGVTAYAQIDLGGFREVVDTLGGVYVDVPLDIIGDSDAGWVDVYAGPQLLDGAHALVFCRSRQYDIGDYQRQANQRSFLQATAKQILASDPLTIINTVTSLCKMTTTNLNVTDIASIANSMRGMQGSDIRTYSIPSRIDMIDGVSYVIADLSATRELFADIEAGEFPDASEWKYQGETAPEYQAKKAVDTSLYTVDVRNGFGIDGSAISVSDMLTTAGYKQGEISNANAYVYNTTLIIYNADEDRTAALDVQARLGYGRVIPSLGRYSFDGNILVVVGADFVP